MRTGQVAGAWRGAGRKGPARPVGAGGARVDASRTVPDGAGSRWPTCEGRAGGVRRDRSPGPGGRRCVRAVRAKGGRRRSAATVADRAPVPAGRPEPSVRPRPGTARGPDGDAASQSDA